MDRPRYLRTIDQLFEVHPVVAILGPRQCGKTTLARMYAEGQDLVRTTRFDLEDPTDLAALANPKLALQGLQGLAIETLIRHHRAGEGECYFWSTPMSWPNWSNVGWLSRSRAERTISRRPSWRPCGGTTPRCFARAFIG